MKYTDLKKIANESLINPRSKDLIKTDKIILDVNNPAYWVTKAREEIMKAETYDPGLDIWHNHIKEAIKLLLLARTYYND